MRALSCPHCGADVRFSWGDFFFVSNRGSSPIYCHGCRKKCTTNDSAGALALLASLFLVGLPVYALFMTEHFPIPGWLTAMALIVSVPLFMGVRAWFIEQFAKELVAY